MSSLIDEQSKAYIHNLLTQKNNAGGTDLFITHDFPPGMKAHAEMPPMSKQKLNGEVTCKLDNAKMNETQRNEFAREMEGNFSVSKSSGSRFRVNVFKQQQHVGMVNAGERRALGGRHRVVDIFAESIEIKSHDEFVAWTQGSLQEFLPHEVMIAAWGDFSLGIIYYEIISALPGVRTDLLQEKEIAAFLKRLFSYWMSKDRIPSQLLADHSVIRCRDIVDGTLKSSMQNMKTALIHAIKDVRGGSDSFYVLLSSNTDITPNRKKTFHQLLPFIDATLRQIDNRPDHTLPIKPSHCDSELSIEDVFKLTHRESEIMGWVCSGKTNVEIGLILDISTFTVKSHLKRIFKKLDVVNRSQAVAKIRSQVSSV